MHKHFRILSLLCLFLSINLLSGCRQKEQLWSGVNNGDLFDEPDEKLDEMLKTLANSKLRMIRIWIDLRLEMDDNGDPLPVGEYNDCLLEQIDHLMMKARREGILLLITLHQYNWIRGASLTISRDFYQWRKCKTPENVYLRSLTEGPQNVYDPYFLRVWGNNYLTSSAAKNAYKQRVNHILNHVNPYFDKPWKDINDVIWAWELQNEPEYLHSATTENLRTWLSEMATYVKSIDPDTYVGLGTKFYSEELGDIEDADVYTLHAYSSAANLANDIQQFNEHIGRPYGKLLLVEEFNVLQGRFHTPGNYGREWRFEALMDECRKNNIPWMFWEHGYWFDDDDIWHGNSPGYSDGVFWGAKIVPAAKTMRMSSWYRNSDERKWKVRQMVGELCTAPNASCEEDGAIYFIDTFSAEPLRPGYTWFDEGTADTYSLMGEHGYLKISASLWQDLWGGTPAKRGAPLMLRQAPPGNYQVETFVSAGPIGSPVQPVNTQFGLFIFQDVNNWIFFGLTNHDFTIDGNRIQGDGLIVTSTISDLSSIVAEHALTPDFVFLRIEKLENNWKFYWKLQYRESWHLLTTLDFVLSNHKVSVGVKTLDLEGGGVENRGAANFDFLCIEQKES